jgi:hypothetical protein
MRRAVARGRILPQSLSTDPRYGRLSLKARVLYPLIWTSCDDQGRITGDPDEIKYAVCPNMDDISKEDIPKLLEEFEAQGFVRVYAASKRKAIQMLDWWEVQKKMQWAWPSEFPPPKGWRDRLRYKRGKEQVVTENWDSGESSPEQDMETISPEGSPESPPVTSPESPPENSPEKVLAGGEPEIQLPGRKKRKAEKKEDKNKNQEQEKDLRVRVNIISPENSGEHSGERTPPEGGLPGRGLFENLLAQITGARDGKESIARVGELYQVCAGRAPPYGRIGAIARKANYDFGYLAKLIWETAGKRPAGDLLDYVEGILRRAKGEQEKGHRSSVRPREDFSGRSW